MENLEFFIIVFEKFCLPEFLNSEQQFSNNFQTFLPRNIYFFENIFLSTNNFLLPISLRRVHFPPDHSFNGPCVCNHKIIHRSRKAICCLCSTGSCCSRAQYRSTIDCPLKSNIQKATPPANYPPIYSAQKRSRCGNLYRNIRE